MSSSSLHSHLIGDSMAAEQDERRPIHADGSNMSEAVIAELTLWHQWRPRTRPLQTYGQ